MTYRTSAQKSAFVISAITHPLLVPVMGFIVFNEFNTLSFQGQSFIILLAVLSVTVVALPAYFVFALKRNGHIHSYEMETLQERKLPLLFTSGTLLFNYYLMQRSHLQEPYPTYFLCVSVTSIVTLVISLFYKISLHTIGIGFMFGLGVVLSYLSASDMRWYLIAISILGGLVSSSRLVLLAHSLPQIYWGFAVGLICSSGMLFLI